MEKKVNVTEQPQELFNIDEAKAQIEKYKAEILEFYKEIDAKPEE